MNKYLMNKKKKTFSLSTVGKNPEISILDTGVILNSLMGRSIRDSECCGINKSADYSLKSKNLTNFVYTESYLDLN